MQLACPKCHGRMEEGFVTDHGHGTMYASEWVKGAPEKSFWTGIRTRGKTKLRIATHRCAACGYLESYAR